MATSSTHKGWKNNPENATLDVVYNGTAAVTVTADGIQSGVTAASIADDSLNGDQVAVVANANTEGGIPLVYRINIAAAGASVASANTDVTVVDKIRVIDVHAVLGSAGAASDTVTVLNGSTAITDALSWSGSDKAIVRATTIDEATHEIAASGTLRVTVSNASTADDNATGVVYVTAVKVS